MDHQPEQQSTHPIKIAENSHNFPQVVDVRADDQPHLALDEAWWGNEFEESRIIIQK